MVSHAEEVNKDLERTAKTLLGLSGSQLTQMSLNVTTQLEEVAEQLGIRIPSSSSHSVEKENQEVHETASQKLINRVRDISQLSGTLEELLQAETQDQVVRIIEQGVKILFNQDTCIFFTWADKSQKRLQAVVSTSNPLARAVDGFTFSAASKGTSLLHKAVAESKLQHTFQEAPEQSPQLQSLDRQLLSLLDKDEYIAVPLVFKKLFHGLMVIGVNGELHDELRSQYASLSMLARHAAVPLHLVKVRKRHTQELLDESIKAASLIAQKIGHEINNPLTILRNYVEIVRMKLDEGEAVDCELQTMDGELARIATLTKQLGNLSVLQQSTLTKRLNINDVVAEAVAFCQTGLEFSSKLTISFVPDSTIKPFALPADSIKQIIINLVKNGVEALEGAGNIIVRLEAITKNEVLLAVEDDGPGIPEAMQRDIFLPGFSTKNRGHSGLGLAIVRKLIQDMQGRVMCKSSERGTTFSITIPTNYLQ
ncbi:MAG: hypothetical protein CSA26_02010 [Desulfobacterales bacterium]|nr:MAG: hypothetical protein CSA26_02010 [Desulfobacterales bacterium]